MKKIGAAFTVEIVVSLPGNPSSMMPCVRAGYSGLEELLGPEGVEELPSQDREGQRYATAQGNPFPEEAIDKVIRTLDFDTTLLCGG